MSSAQTLAQEAQPEGQAARLQGRRWPHGGTLSEGGSRVLLQERFRGRPALPATAPWLPLLG